MPPFERFSVTYSDRCCFTVHVSPFDSTTAVAQQEFIEQAIREALEGGWKDCKVELPPDETHTLICFGRERDIRVGYFLRDRWYTYGAYTTPFPDVTHWQNLPSAPLSEGVR